MGASEPSPTPTLRPEMGRLVSSSLPRPHYTGKLRCGKHVCERNRAQRRAAGLDARCHEHLHSPRQTGEDPWVGEPTAFTGEQVPPTAATDANPTPRCGEPSTDLSGHAGRSDRTWGRAGGGQPHPAAARVARGSPGGRAPPATETAPLHPGAARPGSTMQQ